MRRAVRGGHGDGVVIKKCEILTSESSAVSWGIYLRRAGKEEEEEEEGGVQRAGRIFTHS